MLRRRMKVDSNTILTSMWSILISMCRRRMKVDSNFVWSIG
jgi:hypothetical protein